MRKKSVDIFCFTPCLKCFFKCLSYIVTKQIIEESQLFKSNYPCLFCFSWQLIQLQLIVLLYILCYTYIHHIFRRSKMNIFCCNAALRTTRGSPSVRMSVSFSQTQSRIQSESSTDRVNKSKDSQSQVRPLQPSWPRTMHTVIC